MRRGSHCAQLVFVFASRAQRTRAHASIRKRGSTASSRDSGEAERRARWKGPAVRRAISNVELAAMKVAAVFAAAFPSGERFRRQQDAACTRGRKDESLLRR